MELVKWMEPSIMRVPARSEDADKRRSSFRATMTSGGRANGGCVEVRSPQLQIESNPHLAWPAPWDNKARVAPADRRHL
ncbi:hypothetical protein HZ326_21501 [Fusarium oxysporum f. sp. albedinis]|nr:hypothetical protein HZ326_21501 [Fusarium oxysporum f. sp. albedinis]